MINTKFTKAHYFTARYDSSTKLSRQYTILNINFNGATAKSGPETTTSPL
jgi:hypothetical protein